MRAIKYVCKECLNKTEKEFESMNVSAYAKSSSVGRNFFNTLFENIHRDHIYRNPELLESNK